ncbi:MAG: ABC transporter permease [Phycisphaerae bacterium]
MTRQLDNPPLSHRPRRPIRLLPALLALVIVAFLGLFLILPIGMAIYRAFTYGDDFSLYWLGRVLSNPQTIEQIINSLTVACLTTLVSIILSVPLAMVRGRCRFAGMGVLGVLVLVPMILPPFVGALSMRRLLSQFGIINLALAEIGVLDFSESLPPDWLGSGLAGVVLLQALHLFPILYLNASAALANVDPTYGQAARNLGAGPWKTFTRITLPLMRPGLFAGGTIVFIWSLTDVGTPLIIGYEKLIPVTIFKEIARADTSGWTFSLVFLMLSGSITLYVLGKFLFGRATSAESAKASIASESRRLGVSGTLGAWAMFGVVIFLALLPHVGVVLMAISDKWVNTVFPTEYTVRHLTFVVTQEDTYNSILNSLKYAGTSTVIDIILGSIAAWLIIRSRIRGRSVLDAGAMLPLAVPGLILAAGYVAMTAAGPFEFLSPRRSAFTILVIAYSVRRLPFVVRGVSAGLQQVPETLEEAAVNLGASKPWATLRITLPLILANILAASVLTFAFAMLEVSDSLILAQLRSDYPITKQIYVLAASTGSPETLNQASALGVYGMALLGGTMALATALLGRKLGAIFRA